MVITFFSVKTRVVAKLTPEANKPKELERWERETEYNKKKVKTAILFSVGKRKVSFTKNIAFSDFFCF